jgi:DNA-binding XRE family transcriptional regulator
MTIQKTISPDGKRLVTMTAEEYQDLIDGRDAEAAMRAVADGTMQTLSGAEVDAYLAAKTPLAFWRRHRKMTQRALGNAIGVSQAYIAQIENGVREGSPVMLRDIARVLRVRMEDLVE